MIQKKNLTPLVLIGIFVFMLGLSYAAVFIESNPSPVKYAASLLGMCNPSVRLPLVEIREETKKKVSEALKVAKLL